MCLFTIIAQSDELQQELLWSDFSLCVSSRAIDKVTAVTVV